MAITDAPANVIPPSTIKLVPIGTYQPTTPRPSANIPIARTSDVEIQQAVAIVIGNGDGDCISRKTQIRQPRDIGEFLTADIPVDVVAQNDVFPAVTVQIDNRR